MDKVVRSIAQGITIAGLVVGLAIIAGRLIDSAKADELVTQFDPQTQIYLQDTSSEECSKLNTTGTAYVLDTVEFTKAYGCWADFGEIYEVQLQRGPSKFFHYYLNAHRFYTNGVTK